MKKGLVHGMVTGLVIMGWMLLIRPEAVRAQFVQSPNDLGAADTVDMVVTLQPDVATNKRVLKLDLYVVNDSNNVASATVGFGWLSTPLHMDSAFFSSLTNGAFNLSKFTYYANNIDSSNARDRFLIGGARVSGIGVPLGPSRRLWVSYWFSVASWAGCDSVVVDTFTYNAGVTFKFVDNLNRAYTPYWKKRVVVRDTACVPPANILINPDTLFYTAIQGGSNPASQFASITSSGNPLNVTISESIPWVTHAPNVGTTPVSANIGVNITSLAPGIYFDSVRVTAPNSLNSPRYIYVRLNLQAPPPHISALPTTLNFNWLIGQPPPAPQNIIIKNTGGGTLNWTATKSASWLVLSQSSGIDSASVSCSIDTTGLAAGNYTDTIVVSDPAANNNPQPVVVKLSVGTSLPSIQTDSTTLIFIVNPAEGTNFSRSFQIRNGGVGSLTYACTENAARILSITNPNGSAPGTVTLNYKVSSNVNGLNYLDTVTITSPEAVNSPYKQAVLLLCRSNPAVVLFDPDTVVISVYECQQGSHPLPTTTFQVINQGFDNPMNFGLTFQSNFFTIDHTFGLAPDEFTLTALDAGLPAGTYYDTVVASAPTSVNKKDTMIVRYNVVVGPTPFDLVVSRYQMVFPYKEESGPISDLGLDFFNPLGGCTKWKVHENVGWLFPNDPDSGVVPGHFKVIVDAPGYTFGEYPDTMTVTSPGAQNSPIKVPVLLRVWRFHGDLNYDLSLDIADLTQYVFFLFFYDPIWNPQPELLVGDLDCNDDIDIGDLTYMVNYLFLGGPIPCGNPY